MEIHEPPPADLDALLAFFERIPESERTFFKEAVLDRATVEGWLTAERGRRALAVERRHASSATPPSSGSPAGPTTSATCAWSSTREARGQGLGRALARWALLQAVDAGLAKLSVEVVAEQEGAVAMFSGLGFQAEALLRDHVRDRDGELRDLDRALALGGRRVVGDADGGHRRRARVNCQAIRVGEHTWGPKRNRASKSWALRSRPPC